MGKSQGKHLLTKYFNNNNIKGFHAKRAYIAFWGSFHFLQDRANFWQVDFFGHEKHHSVIVFVNLLLVFQEKSYEGGRYAMRLRTATSSSFESALF